MLPFSIKLQYDNAEFEVDVMLTRAKDFIRYIIIPKDLELEYLFGTQEVHEVKEEGFQAGKGINKNYFRAIAEALINSDKRVLALARA